MPPKKFELKEMTPKERLKLEDLVNLLGSIRGRHTELVSVLIPAGFNKDAVVRQLEFEGGMADNIKSKQTRTAVTTAIEKLTRELKAIKLTPPNGLACYCGNISEKEGQQDIQLWLYEPPKPLNVRLYRCDQVFMIEPLKEMLEVQEVYGLLAIDRQVATIGILIGKKIEVIRELTSGVPSKVRAGGQSAQRFHRVTEGLAKEFFKRTAEAMKEIFFDMPKLKGFLIGGPIPTKDEFIEDGDLVTKLKEKIIAVKDIGYTDEHGLKLLVEASEEEIAEQEFILEKKLIQQFFEWLGKKKDKTCYGYEKVKRALENNAAEKVLISKKLSKEQQIEIEKLCEVSGAEYIPVGHENQEGEQFFNLTQGVGAFLRYAFE
ncbi:peptide chain release factor 1 [Candidatus Pacearchaeota archaeon]|nr:peptide chain release factor 1 [Candidatus Pacearchaeota archaeon]